MHVRCIYVHVCVCVYIYIYIYIYYIHTHTFYVRIIYYLYSVCRTTSNIFYCHLFRTSEFRQVTIFVVMIMSWTRVHFAFAVKTFKIVESVIATQRAVCAQFMLCQNDAVLNRKSILLSVKIL